VRFYSCPFVLLQSIRSLFPYCWPSASSHALPAVGNERNPHWNVLHWAPAEVGKAKREQNQSRQRDVLGVCQSQARWEDVIKASHSYAHKTKVQSPYQNWLILFCFCKPPDRGRHLVSIYGVGSLCLSQPQYDIKRDYTERMLRVLGCVFLL